MEVFHKRNRKGSLPRYRTYVAALIVCFALFVVTFARRLQVASRSEEVFATSALTLETAKEIENVEVRKLLENVVASVTFWFDSSQLLFLDQTIGAIREWRLQPEVGSVTLIIVTNDAKSLNAHLAKVKWAQIEAVDATQLQNGDLLPHWHRAVFANLLVNATRKPTAYYYTEHDTVVDGSQLVAWAKDTLLLNRNGFDQFHRSFFRYEINDKKGCVVVNDQTKVIPRQSHTHFVQVGGRTFVSIDDGQYFGGYLLSAAQFERFYRSEWYHSTDAGRNKQVTKETAAEMVYAINKPQNRTHSTLVPFDASTGTLSLVAAVHHKSDKYSTKPWPFSKICLSQLFVA